MSAPGRGFWRQAPGSTPGGKTVRGGKKEKEEGELEAFSDAFGVNPPLFRYFLF
jgi:hypothetical protein